LGIIGGRFGKNASTFSFELAAICPTKEIVEAKQFSVKSERRRILKKSRKLYLRFNEIG